MPGTLTTDDLLGRDIGQVGAAITYSGSMAGTVNTLVTAGQLDHLSSNRTVIVAAVFDRFANTIFFSSTLSMGSSPGATDWIASVAVLGTTGAPVIVPFSTNIVYDSSSLTFQGVVLGGVSGSQCRLTLFGYSY